MVVSEVVAVVLVIVLACVTTYMAVYGGLGVLGAIRFVRCPQCRHLVPASRIPLEECPHCRHAAQYHHPVHALHEAYVLHHVRPVRAAPPYQVTGDRTV